MSLDASKLDIRTRTMYPKYFVENIAPSTKSDIVREDVVYASRYIEHIMMGFPMLPIIIAWDKCVDEHLDWEMKVLDGNKRWHILNGFLNNEFSLCDLLFDTDCNGKTYSMLPRTISRLFERRDIPIIVFEAGSDVGIRDIVMNGYNS